MAHLSSGGGEVRRGVAGVRWARGFFRLWVLCATLWIGAAVAMVYQPLFAPVHYRPDTIFLFSTSATWDRFSSYDAEGAAAIEAEKRGLFKRYAVPGHDWASAYLRSDVTTEIAGLRIEVLRKVLTASDAESDRQTRSQVLSMFIGFGLMPPIVALVLGAALAWALRGFRRA